MIWGLFQRKARDAYRSPDVYDVDGNLLGEIVDVALTKDEKAYDNFGATGEAFDIPSGTTGTLLHISSCEEIIVEFAHKDSSNYLKEVWAFLKPSDVRLHPWELENNRPKNA